MDEVKTKVLVTALQKSMFIFVRLERLNVTQIEFKFIEDAFCSYNSQSLPFR